MRAFQTHNRANTDRLKAIRSKVRIPCPKRRISYYLIQEDSVAAVDLLSLTCRVGNTLQRKHCEAGVSEARASNLCNRQRQEDDFRNRLALQLKQ